MPRRDASEAKHQPGARVYHSGQQYPEAMRGTATVLEVHPQGDGTFEYLVQRDQPVLPGMSNEPTFWASYHTRGAVDL
jgi:hypothetical protein